MKTKTFTTVIFLTPIIPLQKDPYDEFVKKVCAFADEHEGSTIFFERTHFEKKNGFGIKAPAVYITAIVRYKRDL